MQPCQRSNRVCCSGCSNVWKEGCPPWAQCILRSSLSDLHMSSDTSGPTSAAKDLPFSQVTLGRTWDPNSARVCDCGAAPQQHHVPAASASICKQSSGMLESWHVAPVGQVGHTEEPQLQLAVRDVLVDLFCTDQHSWNDLLDLTYANLRGSKESSCPPMSPYGSLWGWQYSAARHQPLPCAY